MEQVLKSSLISAAAQLKKQLDNELARLDSLDGEDLEKVREELIKKLKKQANQRQEWKNNGHGEYVQRTEDDKEFFEIVDMHLKILATKHIEAKFCKVNVVKCPFLTQRLRIKGSNTKYYIIVFTDFCNCDDFSTDMLEWHLAHRTVHTNELDYQGEADGKAV